MARDLFLSPVCAACRLAPHVALRSGGLGSLLCMPCTALQHLLPSQTPAGRLAVPCHGRGLIPHRRTELPEARAGGLAGGAAAAGDAAAAAAVAAAARPSPPPLLLLAHMHVPSLNNPRLQPANRHCCTPLLHKPTTSMNLIDLSLLSAGTVCVCSLLALSCHPLCSTTAPTL